MTRAAACLALLLISLPLAAQKKSSSETATPAGPQVHSLSSGSVVIDYGAIVAGCPVGMRASQSLWNHNIAVQKGLGHQKFGQRLSLVLKDPRHARITEATVRVHGLTGKNRMLETGNRSDGSESATTIHLSFGQKEDNEAMGDLWVPGFTAVTTVELQDVSYSDGSLWRVSGLDICRVQPDPVMLITER